MKNAVFIEYLSLCQLFGTIFKSIYLFLGISEVHARPLKETIEK